MRPAFGNLASSCLRKLKREMGKRNESIPLGSWGSNLRCEINLRFENWCRCIHLGLGAMTHHASGPSGGFRSFQPAAPPFSTAAPPHICRPSPAYLQYSRPGRALSPETPGLEPPPYQPCGAPEAERGKRARPRRSALIGFLGCQSRLSFFSAPPSRSGCRAGTSGLGGAASRGRGRVEEEAG